MRCVGCSCGLPAKGVVKGNHETLALLGRNRFCGYALLWRGGGDKCLHGCSKKMRDGYKESTLSWTWSIWVATFLAAL